MEGYRLSSRTRAIIACNIGNFIELFDFVIFGFFAATIGEAFFPAGDPMVSLLSSFATYGVGFLMRPVGALMIGSYGDRYGRRAALVLTILVMAGATGLTGLIPTYKTIGVLGPILLVICRLLQGFSTGGEWGGAAAFLAEHAPPGKRGLVSSLASFSVHLGIFAGAVTSTLLLTLLSKDTFSSYGWRIPFIAGFFLGPVGYYIRSQIEETPAFKNENFSDSLSSSPIRETFKMHHPALLAAFGLAIVGGVNNFTFIIFMPSMAVQEFHLDSQAAFVSTTIASVLVTVLIPIVGAISDHIGRRSIMIVSGFGHAVLSYPLFWLIATFPSFASLLCTQCVAAILLSMYSGVISAMMAEMFPTRIRYTGLSAAYGMSITIFGGFAPLISSALIKSTGSAIAPSFYVAAAGLATGATALCLQDRSNQTLV